METKPLLYGLIGFFIGGLLVSVAATTFDRPESNRDNTHSIHDMSMGDMSAMLNGKSGDEYDKAFLESMIAHHEGALDMAKRSADNAKHQELRDLSESITRAQESEINMMKQWQKDWGYVNQSTHTGH